MADAPFPDFNWAAHTMDAAWHDFDLGAIVPVGASAVHFHVKAAVSGGIGSHSLHYRAPSQPQTYFTCQVRPQVVAVMIGGSYVCGMDANRIIKYMGNGVLWTQATFTVIGWWIP